MTPITEKDAIAIALQLGVPTLVSGPPGVGKTAFINSLSKHFNIPGVTIIASLRDPTDFAGLPYHRGEEVALAPPSWAKRLSEIPAPPDGSIGGFVFFDEISCAAPAVQAALLRVIHERVVGDLALPDHIAILAAANPPDQAAGGWDLALPMLNRFFHVEWHLDHLAWCEGFKNGFTIVPTTLSINPKSETYQQKLLTAKNVIAEFILRKKDNLFKLPKVNTLAFPTPRTWEMYAKLLAAADTLDIDNTLFGNGTVGSGPSIEFCAWRPNQAALADVEDAMRGGTTFISTLSGAPKEVINAFLAGIAAYATKMPTNSVGVRAWYILYQVWALNSCRRDILVAPAGKLVQILGTRPKDAFRNADAPQEAFLKDVHEVLAQTLGLTFK